MGFLRKYLCIILVCLLSLFSSFLSVHSMTDLLAETRGLNITTKLVLEELVIEENNEVVFQKQEDRPGPLLEGDSSMTMLPGYPLYWGVMERVSSWYSPHSFQLVKLLLLTVSLANLASSLLCLLCHCLPGSRHFWCGHPTPLLLVEGGLTLALLLLLLMMVLGRQDGLLGQREALQLGGVMIGIGAASWLVGDHYREERRVHMEKKLLDFETIEYSSTSGEESEEEEITRFQTDPDLQEATHQPSNRSPPDHVTPSAPRLAQ